MSKQYTPTIGLEVHAELKTKTKMFCPSLNNTDEERPNVNICPICMGHPGTLPVINKEAVKHVLKVGVAVGGTLADYTEFDRKNYFYPDIPKGYQISQYKYPLVSGGSIHGVELTRIHLEEDTAKSSHDKGDYSLVDFNRAGVPLMELVTEPVIHSAKEAGDFARELQLLLRTLKVAEANMEKGEMRVEANISVSDTEEFGTKVEVKNINSFKAVEKAIEYEIARQIEVLEKGERVEQETRGWDENKQITFSQRKKESSHDYRYFPDPDLPKLKISEIPEFSQESLENELPELPWDKRTRYMSYGLGEEDAEMYVRTPLISAYFESVLDHLENKESSRKLASNYITSDLIGLIEGEDMGKLSPKEFASIIQMVEGGELSSRGAKDLLKILYEEGGKAKEVAEEKGLLQKSDTSYLESLANEIISENPDAVAEYKAGKEASLKFLMGQGMKKSKGSANPQLLENILKSKI